MLVESELIINKYVNIDNEYLINFDAEKSRVTIFDLKADWKHTLVSQSLMIIIKDKIVTFTNDEILTVDNSKDYFASTVFIKNAKNIICFSDKIDTVLVLDNRDVLRTEYSLSHIPHMKKFTINKYYDLYPCKKFYCLDIVDDKFHSLKILQKDYVEYYTEYSMYKLSFSDFIDSMNETFEIIDRTSQYQYRIVTKNNNTFELVTYDKVLKKEKEIAHFTDFTRLFTIACSIKQMLEKGG